MILVGRKDGHQLISRHVNFYRLVPIDETIQMVDSSIVSGELCVQYRQKVGNPVLTENVVVD